MLGLGQWISSRSTNGSLSLVEAVLGGALEIARREVALPDLGGDEDLVARQARGAKALAHCLLVAVHRRGVDVAIAEPERGLDHARAGLAAQVPGAEPDDRNAGAVGFDGSNGTPPRYGSEHAASPGSVPTQRRAAISAVACVVPSTENATSGAWSSSLSSARAGPRGERLPCSQLRTVSIGTPIRAANSACVSRVCERMRRALAASGALAPVGAAAGCSGIGGGSTRSCPSEVISTRRPSALSLTRIMEALPSSRGRCVD